MDKKTKNERQTDRSRVLRSRATYPERLLWSRIKPSRMLTYRFRRQHPIDGYVVDFCCVSEKIVVEIDGLSHAHTGIDDATRQQRLEKLGYRVIRITNDDVIRDVDNTVEWILNQLQ